jgi:glycine cleavage system H protein
MEEKKYSKDHEWIEIKDDIAIVGITDHAQGSLGDIVFIDLPEINKDVNLGDDVSVIESVKAASDIYAPADGKIIEVNEKLNENASLINLDAENDGWIFKMKLSNLSQLENLMNSSDYDEFLKKE